MRTVKEVAEIFGISPHTVRFYDNEGLIPGTKRSDANQRLFDDEEIEWLFVSLSLRRSGLSVKEVKRYVELYQQGDGTIAERLEIMVARRKETLAEVEALENRLAMLDRKIEHYQRPLEGLEDAWSHDYMQKLIEKERVQNER